MACIETDPIIPLRHDLTSVLETIEYLEDVCGLYRRDYIVIEEASLVLRGLLATTDNVGLLVTRTGFHSLEDAGAVNEHVTAEARRKTNFTQRLFMHKNDSLSPISGVHRMLRDNVLIGFDEAKVASDRVCNIPCVKIE